MRNASTDAGEGSDVVVANFAIASQHLLGIDSKLMMINWRNEHGQ